MGMMHKNFMDILNVLYFDETLLRLLYYPPKNLVNNTPDPLDPSLSNVLDVDTDWSIRNLRIMKTPKVDDLTADTPICRMLIYFGKRTGNSRYYLTSEQELIIDILCHESFEEGDLRVEKLSDRLNELFVSEKITGIGKMEYLNGGQIGTPSEYVGYRNTYRFGSISK